MRPTDPRNSAGSAAYFTLADLTMVLDRRPSEVRQAIARLDLEPDVAGALYRADRLRQIKRQIAEMETKP